MKKYLSLVLLPVFSVFALSAQETGNIWSLQRCIMYAHENNLQVKRQRLNVELARKDLDQSFFAILPDLNAGADHQFSSGRSLNLETYEWENNRKQQGSLGLAGNITLFNGFRTLNTIKFKRYSFLSSVEDLEKIKDDITLSIINAYLQVLFNEELLNIAKNQHEVTMLQVLKIKRLVEVGNLSKSEFLQVNAQAASEKLDIATTRYALNLSVLELTQLLDLDSMNNFEIVHPVNLNVESLGEPEPVDVIFEIAVSRLPQIKSSEYEVKISEELLALQKGQRIPKITLGGLYYSRYLKDAYNPVDPGAEYFFKDQLRNNQYSQLSVGLDIPVFNRMITQTGISKAKIRLEDSQYALEQNVQYLYKSIQQVHSNALAALEKYHASIEAVYSNEEAFNYTRQKFEVGLVNSVDYNVAKNNLLKARSDLLQAKYEFIFRMKIIDFYKGKEISL